ncbi:MAG: DUF642 domain-containing protein [Luteolibacter sp.]|uniref:DUF642 domain-containing protein n=1 Tax=Luteolibacter sp. TaxID=1962973 RepID=UPI003265765E
MKTLIFRKWLTVPAWVILSTARLTADVPNGGFESDFSGWLATGNVTIQSAPPYLATEGAKLAVFNSVNSTPNGALEKAVAIVPGHRYRLEFDVGNLSYNSLHQRMQVVIEDNVSIPPPPGARPPYITDTIDIAGPGGGATAWVAASYEFTPLDNFVRLTFRDVSPATNSLDLVLDHIRLTEIPLTSLVNGGFEDGFASWTSSGNVVVRSTPPYGPTEGTKLAAFNAGNSTPDGSLSQEFVIIPGQRYRLEFDVGNLSYNALHQRMKVQVQYRIFSIFYPIMEDTIDISGPGGGATAWVPASYEFTTSSAVITLRFTDVSTATNALDLVLDHVRLTPASSTDLITNGSFETGFAGWTVPSTANVSVQSGAPYSPTDGSKLAAFNAGNSTPNGSLAQTISTVPGQRYRLEFDAGNLAYVSLPQRMQVVVAEHVGAVFYSPLQDTFDIPAPSVSGGTRWQAKSYEFIPQSDTVTLVFDDLSLSTNSQDLLLDHVRLVPVP